MSYYATLHHNLSKIKIHRLKRLCLMSNCKATGFLYLELVNVCITAQKLTGHCVASVNQT